MFGIMKQTAFHTHTRGCERMEGRLFHNAGHYYVA